MKKRRKKRSKAAAIINAVLAGLLVLTLAGSVFLNQNYEETLSKKAALKKEKSELTKKQEETEKEIETLQKEIEKLKETQEEIQQEAQEETKDAEAETDEPKEDTPQVSGIEGIKDVIANRVSGQTGENWGVSVCRLSDGAKEYVGEGKMTAASLIKLYIMGAVYTDYDNLTSANGKEKVDSLLHSMITVSDNDASNALVKMLGKGDNEAGKSAVNAYCSANGYADSSMGRMLLETNTDKENYTSAKDCTAFLEKVYRGEIAHADEMLSLLKQQERTGKIPAGVPAGVATANKTGELSNVENDAAIILSEKEPYILCVMSENLKNPSGARQTIVNLSADVYNHFKK